MHTPGRKPGAAEMETHLYKSLGSRSTDKSGAGYLQQGSGGGWLLSVLQKRMSWSY